MVLGVQLTTPSQEWRKGKGKVHPCTGHTAYRGSRGIALPFLDHGTRRGEGWASRPGRSLSPGKTRHLLYRMLGGPQSRSGQVRKISSPPGFDPWTVQPVASRYTDYSTRPTRNGGVILYLRDIYRTLILSNNYSSSLLVALPLCVWAVGRMLIQ